MMRTIRALPRLIGKPPFEDNKQALRFALRTINVGIVGGVTGFFTYQMYTFARSQPAHFTNPNKPFGWLDRVPTRSEILKSMQDNPEDVYDILIIGGGSTGVGVALDAVSRGLRTVCVERDDFASATSSRSTKLIHGGVRYLQKAIMNFDREQYNMVCEALRERSNLLEIAPHLTKVLPIMLPVYKWWELPYYWFGIKLYDAVAGKKLLKHSYMMNKQQSLEAFPLLKDKALKGSIVYYDGQQNDARMNITLALTAARLGALVANQTEVVELMYRASETVGESARELAGAKLRDNNSGKEWIVRAKCVINATGPFTDSIRQMDNREIKAICQPSLGVHITLPDYYSPLEMGLLDPNTKDGRVIFFLPWEGVSVAGTTDTPCSITTSPEPTRNDVEFIMNEVIKYLDARAHPTKADVLSAWAGIRPLVLQPNKDTASIARNHIIEVSDTNLITIAGGKWTTYRQMAEETVDEAIKVCRLSPQHKKSQTLGLTLEGGHEWTPTLFVHLIQQFGIEEDVAKHLVHQYGDRAKEIAELAESTGRRWPARGKRLVEDFPYLEAEVKFAVRREFALNAIDVIARRTRLAFQNVDAAKDALPRTIEIMAVELGWNAKEQKRQFDMAMDYIQTQMGGVVINSLRSSTRAQGGLSLDRTEVAMYVKKFQENATKDGTVSLTQLKKMIKDLGLLSNYERELDVDTFDEALSRRGKPANDGKGGVKRNFTVAEFLATVSDIRAGAFSTKVLEETRLLQVRSSGQLYQTQAKGAEKSSSEVSSPAKTDKVIPVERSAGSA